MPLLEGTCCSDFLFRFPCPISFGHLVTVCWLVRDSVGGLREGGGTTCTRAGVAQQARRITPAGRMNFHQVCFVSLVLRECKQ